MFAFEAKAYPRGGLERCSTLK